MQQTKLSPGYKTKGVYTIKVFKGEDIENYGLNHCIDNNLQKSETVQENLTTRYLDDVMNYNLVGTSIDGQIWTSNNTLKNPGAYMAIFASVTDLTEGFDYYNKYTAYGLTHTYITSSLAPFNSNHSFDNCFLSYKNLFNSTGTTATIRTIGLVKLNAYQNGISYGNTNCLVSVIKLNSPLNIGTTDKLYIEYTLRFIFDTNNKDCYQLYQGLFGGNTEFTYLVQSSDVAFCPGGVDIGITTFDTARSGRSSTLTSNIYTQNWFWGKAGTSTRFNLSSSTSNPFVYSSIPRFSNDYPTFISQINSLGYYQRPYGTYIADHELIDGNKIYLKTDRFKNTSQANSTFSSYASYAAIFKNQVTPSVTPSYKIKTGISGYNTDFTNPPTHRATSSTSISNIGIPFVNNIYKLLATSSGDIAPLSYGIVTFNNDNTITTTVNWKLVTGYSIIFRFSSANALPSGISAGVDYYAKPISDNSPILRLSSSQVNSDNNIFLTFSEGNGAHTYFFTKTNTANVDVLYLPANNQSDFISVAGIKRTPRGAYNPFRADTNSYTPLNQQFQNSLIHRIRWSCIDSTTKNVYYGINTRDSYTDNPSDAKNIECGIYSKGLLSIEDLDYEGQHNSTTCGAVLGLVLYTGDMSGKIKKWNINPSNGKLTYDSEINTGVDEVILSLEKDPHREVVWGLLRNNGLIKITSSAVTYHFITTSGSPLNGASATLFNQTVGSLLVSDGKVKWGCRTASISLDSNNLKNTLSQSVYVGKDTASFQNGGIFFDDLQVYNTITTNTGLVSGGACQINIDQSLGSNRLLLVKYKPTSNESGNQATLSFYTKDQGGTGHNIVRVYTYTNNTNGSELNITFVKELVKGIPDVTVTETNSRNYGTDISVELGVRGLIMLADAEILGDTLMFKRILWHDTYLSSIISSVSVTTESNYTYRPFTANASMVEGAWGGPNAGVITPLRACGFNPNNGVVSSQPYAIFMGYQDHTNTTLTYYAFAQQSKVFDTFISNGLEFMQMLGLCERFVYDKNINSFWDTGAMYLSVANMIVYSGPAKESYSLPSTSIGANLTWNFANDYAYSPATQLVSGEAQVIRFLKYPYKNPNQTASMKLIWPYYDMVEKTLNITSTASYTVPEKTSDTLFKALALVTVKEGSTIYREVETVGALVPGAFFKTPLTGVIQFHATDVGKNLNLTYSYTINRY